MFIIGQLFGHCYIWLWMVGAKLPGGLMLPNWRTSKVQMSKYIVVNTRLSLHLCSPLGIHAQPWVERLDLLGSTEYRVQNKPWKGREGKTSGGRKRGPNHVVYHVIFRLMSSLDISPDYLRWP